MPEPSERALEASSAALERQQDKAVVDIRRSLESEGCAECEECGDDIPQARRNALPSARRCAACQWDYERKLVKRGA